MRPALTRAPRFSVVVPTRDRPDLLDFCLAGIAAQTFADVEVIVSDNPLERSARETFDRWARDGWRYVTPGSPVPMHDNFELACEEATGDYVAVVIDKTVLHPSALELANRQLDDEVDIVTWRNEGYNPVDEEHALGPGLFATSAPTAAPARYDPMVELRTRFAMAERRGVDHVHYVRGKIPFGAFSRRLLERIRETTGRVFHPLTPDYTSMVAGSVLARAAVDLGRPLLVSYNSTRGNGQRASTIPSHARDFIEGAEPGGVAALPISGLYASVHNIVAYDLMTSAARLPGSTLELDRRNLVRRAREDLDLVSWPVETERAEQYAIVEAEEARLGVEPEPPAEPERGARATVAAMLERTPRLERLVYRATGRTKLSFAPYESPVAAARAADAHYSGKPSDE
jgi:hypothetical protein